MIQDLRYCMFLRKRIFSFTAIVSMSLAQGLFNGYGVGDLQNWKSASVGGASSVGLVYSFQKDVSLSNPTTWSNLKYTF